MYVYICVCVYVYMYVGMYVYVLVIMIHFLNYNTTVVWDNPFKLTQPVTIIIVGSLTILLFISALINGLFVCKIRKKQYHEINRDVTPDNSPRRSSHIPLKKFPESTSSVDSGIVNNTYMDAQEEKEKDREWNKTQNES